MENNNILPNVPMSKPDNFFKKHLYLILAIVFVLLVAIVTTIIILLLVNSNKADSNNNVSVTTTVPVTSTIVTTSPTTSSTALVTTTSVTTTTADPYAGWKEYYDAVYDIHIRYPENYNIEKNPSPGKIPCDQAYGLRSSYNCHDSVAFPNLTLVNGKSNITLFGPTPGGIGGGCGDQFETINIPLLIRNKNYTYVIKKLPDMTYCSLDYRLPNVNATGVNSIWQSSNLQFNASDINNLNIIKKIIESIY